MTPPPVTPRLPRLPTADQLIYAGSVAVVAVVSYVAASLLPLPEPYWAPIAAVVVLSPERDATKQAAGDRFVGTLVGSFTGWAGAAAQVSVSASGAAHQNLAVYGLAVLVGVLVCGLLRLDRASRICAVTTSVIVLIPRPLAPHLVAFHRFCEVSFGAGCALVITMADDAVRRRWRAWRAR